MIDSKLIGAFGFAIVFEILMPLAVGLWLRRRYGVSWRVFGYGALIFFASQIAFRVPLVQIIQASLTPLLLTSEELLLGWIVVLSFSAGIVEEGGRWLGYRYLLKDKRTWENALMFGAGHGGLESMVMVGGLTALTLVQVLALQGVDPGQLPVTPEQQDQIRQVQKLFQETDWWMPLVGAYERLMAMSLHITLSVIVLQVFLRGSFVWLIAAIGYHGMANLGAVLTSRWAGPIWAEVFLTALGALNLYLIVRLRGKREQ